MRTRVVIDRDAFAEKKACLEADGVDPIQASQWASMVAYNTGFALAATALANGDDKPARELCRREAQKHGREWAEGLRQALKEAVAEANALEPMRK